MASRVDIRTGLKPKWKNSKREKIPDISKVKHDVNPIS